MNILISNDDGWQAPGIVALAEAVQSFASIKVVAPDRNRSAASNSLTLMQPIRATQQQPDWYSVDGTPADCVNLALNGLFDWTPDLVISGINTGPNLGDDVLYSGTVAAAIEGYFHGYPAMAFSLAGVGGRFDIAAAIAVDIIHRCVASPVLRSGILSVNIPDLNSASGSVFSVTRLGQRGRSSESNMHHQTDPRGEKIYWIGAVGKPEDAGPGTDFHAIANGEVSISPISTDMTAHKHLAALGESFADQGLTGDQV